PLQPALEEIAFARAIERPFAVERKRERYVRARHGKPSDNVGGRKPFGTRGFEKLQSGRSGKKELTDLDTRCRPARRAKRRGSRSFQTSAFDQDCTCLAGVRAADDREPRNGTDRRQGLATESERLYMREIVVAVGPHRQFGSRVAQHRKGQRLAIHAAAIIFDENKIRPTR